MSINTQKMICEAFEYQKPFAVDVLVSSVKDAKVIELVDNNTETCAMCGQVHPVGYRSKNGAASLLKAMISDTYNECYSLSISNFICEYCGYSFKAYGSPSKMKGYGKKMINVLIHEGKAIEKNFNSNDKNELYQILLAPPKPPFVVLINSRGTVLENLVFTAKATISKELIVVNYGLNNLEVNPKEVFAAIEDAKIIANEYGIEVGSDTIWNRADNVSIKVKRKTKKGMIDLNAFYDDMGLFIEKYNRDCRLVGKMVLAAYLKDNPMSKTKTSAKGDTLIKEVSNNTTSQTSLFDF
jgi:CRISPR type IV-associated protein Csf1